MLSENSQESEEVVTTMAAPKLHKYLQKANRVLSTLAEQPDRVWAKTQRELGEYLELSQPELSGLLKLLLQEGRIRRGPPLPGVRGSNYMIELVDDTPFTHNVRRGDPTPKESDDRALKPGEEIEGAIHLGDITVDKIGLAVIRALEEAWAKEARHAQVRAEQQARLREYREQITEDRRLAAQLARDKENLARQLAEVEAAEVQLRGQLNKVLMSSPSKAYTGGSYQLRDLLDDESLKVLDTLMRGKPGHYRESDRELGLSAETG